MLLPRKGRYALIDYEKAFCPDPAPGRDIFKMRGVDRAEGAALILRPDQFVAAVLPLAARADIAAFFDRFMIAR